MTETERIELIYSVYPRKVGKRKALKEIEKALGRILQEYRACRKSDGKESDEVEVPRFLWKKTKQYAESPAGQKPADPSQDFRPHPATWFHQDRFYDDPAEWQKPNGSRNGKQTVTANADQIARANAKIAELGGNHLRAR